MHIEPYEGRIFRPPSEAESLILQVTVGCSHNTCTFCSMYKEKQFHIKPFEMVESIIETYQPYAKDVTRIFIADGDALILPMDYWHKLLHKLHQTFPYLERVTAYGTPKSILLKSVEALKSLKELGLTMVYMGLETGSESLLETIQKGTTTTEVIAAAKQLKTAGIKQSVTVIAGLGGKEHWKTHAAETAMVLNQMQPEYVGVLTLMMEPGTPLYEDYRQGKFQVLSAEESLMEMSVLLEHLSLEQSVFRSNHASNYLNLAGSLPRDKDRLVAQVRHALETAKPLKDERYRRL